MNTCIDCQREFEKAASNKHKRCSQCRYSRTMTNSCSDCGATISVRSQRCKSCAKKVDRAKRGHTVGRSTITGGYRYVIVNTSGKRMAEHRWVMEQHLGRKLRPNENVHHLNGVRSDNRLENLELWVKCQPAGQRVEDLVAWARQIIKEYADEQ